MFLRFIVTDVTYMKKLANSDIAQKFENLASISLKKTRHLAFQNKTCMSFIFDYYLPKNPRQ